MPLTEERFLTSSLFRKKIFFLKTKSSKHAAMLARRPRHRESGSILWLKQRGHVVSFYLHSDSEKGSSYRAGDRLAEGRDWPELTPSNRPGPTVGRLAPEPSRPEHGQGDDPRFWTPAKAGRSQLGVFSVRLRESLRKSAPASFSI